MSFPGCQNYGFCDAHVEFYNPRYEDCIESNEGEGIVYSISLEYARDILSAFEYLYKRRGGKRLCRVISMEVFLSPGETDRMYKSPLLWGRYHLPDLGGVTHLSEGLKGSPENLCFSTGGRHLFISDHFSADFGEKGSETFAFWVVGYLMGAGVPLDKIKLKVVENGRIREGLTAEKWLSPLLMR